MLMTERKPRKLLTTGQIAEMTGLNHKLVTRWIDAGHLVGIHLPGLQERRVHRDELRRFAAAHDLHYVLRALDEEEGVVRDDESPPEESPPEPPRPKRKGRGRPPRKP